ncbi:MAG: MFS transporter [Syntrophales bacterium]
MSHLIAYWVAWIEAVPICTLSDRLFFVESHARSTFKRIILNFYPVMKSSLQSRYSYYALSLLLAVNLLNYVDRQVIYAVFPFIKDAFTLTDTSLGLLGSAFMLCYMISAPALGWVGDHMSRVTISSAGVAVWSVATSFSGLAASYGSLLLARMSVGIGEASFGTVSPGLLADYFPKEERGRILSYFYLAIPVGSALGYLLGGILGERFGWQAAFFVVGLPGILLAIPVWFLREPQRGATEGKISAIPLPARTEYVPLFSNRSYVINTLAMTAMTFAMGGLAQWVPTFLYRIHELDLAQGNTYFGVITVLAGITGTLIGGWLGDFLQAKTEKGYLMVSGWGFVIGAPLAVYALVTHSVSTCLGAMFFAEFFLFLNTGPLNTIIVNVTAPGLRARAFAVNILVIHALGDAMSPAALGWLSDRWGLRNALLITPVAFIVAAVFCFLCGRFIGEDSGKIYGR